ncbi:MAG: hypothetical protein JSV91_13975 [Phycisphaerales bacterium]|nr:MAG: hypothetical protein JSV91_13975 [Phycisphaerales bacterium]
MLTAVEVFVALSILWAAVSLLVQVVAAWGGGRKDYSRPAGSPIRATLYNFTVAMTPAHKESIRLHPMKFAAGVVMHSGALIALLGAMLLLVWPAAGLEIMSLLRPLAAIALLAGLYLLVRRFTDANLKVVSAADDYLAILATCGLLLLACVYRIDADNQTVFLIYTGGLFIYLPLGKLRHAVFFFVARGDYGRRLGYRGVYPPAASME